MLTNVFELVMMTLFAALGVRSLVYWVRRPWQGRDATDHLLFALFVTSRAGWWLALSGLFALYAATEAEAEFVQEVQDFDWYLLVLLGLAALQFVSGFILGRRASG